MVRLKHRYLLVSILHPDPPPNPYSSASKTPSTSEVPSQIQFHRSTSDKLTPQLLIRLLRDEIAFLFGDWGSGVVAGSLQVKYLSTATSTLILRVSRPHYRLVWAALTSITSLPLSSSSHSSSSPHPSSSAASRHKGGYQSQDQQQQQQDERIVFQVVRVSGTIRKAEEEAIRRAKESILRARGVGQEKKRYGGLEGWFGKGKEGDKDVEMRDIGDEDVDEDDEDEE